MRLEDVRLRLPVVDRLPDPDDRRVLAPRADQAPVPRLAVWEITLACDLACIACGSRAGAARPNELDTDECLDVVAQLRELGVGEVTIIGGEAYLRNDFITIIRAIRDAGMRCTMVTGGRNLTAARIEAMREAGINAVGVSIDGTADTHDELRGVVGSHAAAMRALADLRAAGITTTVNTQINRKSLPELDRVLDDVAALGIRSWQLQLTAAFGRAADHPELLLQPYMMLELQERLRSLLDRCDALGIRLWPANNLGYFGPLEARLRKTQKVAGHTKGCVAGRHQIGLEADGAVKGCPSLGGPENVAGNVRQHRLRALWEGTRELAYIRERTTAELWGYCATCYYADVCRAGCTATSEPLLGRAGNNPFCFHRAIEREREGLRERIELVAPAPGVPFDHAWYRIVCESNDPDVRARTAPCSIDEPRTSRMQAWLGAGEPLSATHEETP